MYQGHHHEVALTQDLLFGEFAWLYWLSMLMLAVPFGLLFGQFLLQRHHLPLIVLSGLLVNIAPIGKRILLVVPSQVRGTLLPYDPGTYSPTWVEYSIIVGLFALGTLLYMLFVKIFPIMEVAKEEIAALPAAPRAGPPAPAVPPGARVQRADMRTPLAVGMVVLGFALQAISYFFLAAPWGTPTSPLYSNPRLPPAPAIFILGVVLVFLAAVVYELLPEPPGQSTAQG
ncbi:MAG: hypothetical protein C4345_10860 [Chloroflexota bacterium]